MNASPFRRGTIVALVVLVLGSLGAGTFMAAFRERLPVRSAQADAFSRSAIGHRALVFLLERSGGR